MDIRQATHDDYHDISELLPPRWASDFAIGYSHDQQPQKGVLVAVRENRIIGYLKGSHISGAWKNLAQYEDQNEDWNCSEVKLLFVAAQERERGIGGALMRAFETDASNQCNRLAIVFPQKGKNLAQLHRFYGALGYTHREPGGLDRGTKPWLMAKDI